jgi:DNA-binding GntR family transcriptional regulator
VSKSNVNLSDSVYEYLLEMMFRKQILCGEKIQEEKIATQLNISRTPIREALRRLAAEGLVNMYPKRFVEVISFSEKDIRDIGITRLNQDILAAQLAVFYGSNADFMKLKEIGEECERCAKSGDPYLRITKDSEFHLFLSKISKNEVLINFQSQLYLKVCLLQAFKYTNVETSLKQISLHSQIIDALIARDTNRVISVIQDHLVGFYGLDQYIDTFPLKHLRIK